MIMIMKLTVDYNPRAPLPQISFTTSERQINRVVPIDVSLTDVLIILYNQNETLELRQSP